MRHGEARVRIAVLSDVHGNLAGLRAVAAALVREEEDGGAFDHVVVASDHLWGGPRPRETWAALGASGWRLLRGNEDERLAARNPEDVPNQAGPRYRRALAAFHAWTRAALSSGGDSDTMTAARHQRCAASRQQTLGRFDPQPAGCILRPQERAPSCWSGLRLSWTRRSRPVRVFVTQTRGVVILVPEATLEELRGDGYREASPAEVASWYRLRGIMPPTCILEQAQMRPLRVPVVIRVSDEGTAMHAA